MVKHPHHIAVGNPTFLRIYRVDPHLLTAGCFQDINVAVGRVSTGFVMETKQLQWEGSTFRGVPAFKGRGINWQWAYHFIFFQFPGTGNFRQLAGINFNLTGRCFKWICLGVVTKCFVGDKMTIGIFTLIDTHFFSSS